MTDDKALTPESLAFSASLFTSQIDSWIPQDFGTKRTESQRAAEFDKAMRAAASMGGENDKRGLGHPELLSASSAGSSGLMALDKRLRKGNQRAASASRMDAERKLGAQEVSEKEQDEEEEEEEEEESRSRMVGKSKRRTTVDLLASKKKAKSQLQAASTKPQPQPLLDTQASSLAQESLSDTQASSLAQESLSDTQASSLRQASSLEQVSPGPEPGPPRPSQSQPQLKDPHSPVEADNPQTPETRTTSSPGGSGDFPFPGPVALDSPRAKQILATKKTALHTIPKSISHTLHESASNTPSESTSHTLNESTSHSSTHKEFPPHSESTPTLDTHDSSLLQSSEEPQTSHSQGTSKQEQKQFLDSDIEKTGGENTGDKGDIIVQSMTKTQRRRDKRRLAKQANITVAP